MVEHNIASGRIEPAPADTDSDAGTYPLLSAYLANLPQGLNSYPQCRMLGDLAREVQAEHPTFWSDPKLPRALRYQLAKPWSEGEFVPIVFATCQAFVVRERLNLSDDDYVRRASVRALALMRRPLYKAVLSVMSPNLLLLGVGWRWNQFMLGTTIESAGGDRRSHKLLLTTPPYLLTSAWKKFIATTFTSVIAAAHGNEPRVSYEELSREKTEFTMEWT